MAKSYYEFFCPVKVISGHMALEHIPFELGTVSAIKPLIITDKGVRQNGLLDHVLGVFKDSAIDASTIFDDVPPDSSLQTVRSAAKIYRDNGCDAIIAVGGGSVIDTSKSVNVLVTEGGDDLLKYAGAHNLTRPLKPLYVIPTTAGTGSEMTMIAVISDLENNLKIAFASYFLMPNAAVLDPRMTVTLPAHLTAMTAMDAMTHAIEAYTCIGHNPISDAYATAAIQKVSRNLIAVLDNPSDADGRLELAQASTMAGIAFSNSMVGLVHSLGHATGAVVHLPHGLCMNLYLPFVLEHNQDVNGERIGELLLYLAGADVYAATPESRRCAESIHYIRQLRDTIHQKAKLPRTLRETGKVSEAQLKEIAAKALNDGSIVYNPKETTLNDLIAILHRAW